MKKDDKRLKNLKSFKPGQSGNPNGRPKGARSRKTIVKEWLSVNEIIKNPITGEKEELEQQDIITLALIKKARTGDVNAFRELMDLAYDKVKQSIDHTGDMNLNQRILQNDPLLDSYEEDEENKVD